MLKSPKIMRWPGVTVTTNISERDENSIRKSFILQEPVLNKEGDKLALCIQQCCFQWLTVTSICSKDVNEPEFITFYLMVGMNDQCNLPLPLLVDSGC